MERKVREMNEEYVPELRNWAEEPTTKSRVVGTNNNNNNNNKLVNNNSKKKAI